MRELAINCYGRNLFEDTAGNISTGRLYEHALEKWEFYNMFQPFSYSHGSKVPNTEF
jgi:hypothetical protein